MAKSAALERLKKIELRRSAVAAKARAAAKATVKENTDTMFTAGAGFGIGFAEQKGFTLPTIDSVEPTALYAAGTFLGAMFIKDKQIKRILKTATNGLAAVAAYKMGKNGFQSVFQYTKPATQTSGWGEEIVETGEF
jgi:hypothetical protein